jgi:hypothetical protein
MGIKFHCPNGHKLNVKAFLAGKKGVCPKCGTRVRIPLSSEPELESDVQEPETSAVSKSNGSGGVAAAVRPAPAVAVAPAAHLATVTPGDPIDEAPSAIWYVRPPTGGQYGPARGDIMRQWISEGRVSSDSLVWREGWTDWQTAGKLFPALDSPGAAAPPSPAPSPAPTVPVTPRTSSRTAIRYEAKKHQRNNLAIGIFVGLGILCLALIAALVYLVFFNR